jgi:hypothetical protein
MAIINPKSRLKGLRGRIDNVVFRELNGQTVASLRPNPQKHPRTPAQLAEQQRFACAMRRAVELMSDPDKRARYNRLARAPKTPVFNLALSDILRAPDIKPLILEPHASGARITIQVDDVTVDQVSVSVQTSDGAALESGPALRLDHSWCYDLKQPVAAGVFYRVAVTARDFPGNESTRVEMLAQT